MELRKGYNPEFLENDFVVSLPELGLELQNDVLKNDVLKNGYIADYIHYSVVMSKSNRQAFFSAANLHQDDFKAVKGRKWFLDPRIGLENQIGPEAYTRNDWDRGHLTRRTAVTWGSPYLSKRASNDSCSYANASFQHANFNQDEWRVPEKIVSHFDKDLNNRLCIFTGPVFTDADRWYTRNGLKNSVRIPSAFWKVIVFIGKESGKLECQSYLMYQDAMFLADKRGQHNIDHRNYQVTITEIERLTGLEFSEDLFNANPLYFYPRKGINNGPEAFCTPKNFDKKELDKGIVFNRKDAESEVFKNRKREIIESDFDEYIERGKVE